MAFKAVDKTAGAFSSIRKKATATGADLRNILGGALTAAGAYMSLSSVKAGIDELGKLSDIAMKTSTSTEELTKMETALGALGIQNMSIENIARSFDYMAKTTGRSGMAGFYETISEIGKIEDASKRGQEAMRIFGRSGMEFMPLINAADQGVAALETVINAMPAIPQAAAAAGDAAADATGFMMKSVKSVWLEGLGTICRWLGENYEGGVEQAALSAGNSLTYYTKMAVAKAITYWHKLQSYLTRFSDTIGAFIGTKLGGGSWSEAFSHAGDAWDTATRHYEEDAKRLDEIERQRTRRFEQEFKDREIAVRKYSAAAGKAAVSLSKREGSDAKKAISAALKSPQIRNELMLGGHDANRLAVLGPQMQSETKKQTAILEKIAENTKQTADEVEDLNTAGTEVWNG